MSVLCKSDLIPKDDAENTDEAADVEKPSQVEDQVPPRIPMESCLLNSYKKGELGGALNLPALKKPLGFKVVGELVWDERIKGSVVASRPWFRMFEREKAETFCPLFKNVIEPQVLDLTVTKAKINSEASVCYWSVEHDTNNEVSLVEMKSEVFSEAQKIRVKTIEKNVEDSNKPVLIISKGINQPLISISATFQLKAADAS